jgi:hypothetical protein
MSDESQHSTLWLVTHHLSLVTGFLVLTSSATFLPAGELAEADHFASGLPAAALGEAGGRTVAKTYG